MRGEVATNTLEAIVAKKKKGWPTMENLKVPLKNKEKDWCFGNQFIFKKRKPN